MSKSDAREAALDILDRARKQNRRLSEIRDLYFKKQQLACTERNRITGLTQEINRWQGRLDYWLGGISTRPLDSLQPRLLLILRLAVYEMMIDRTNPDYAVIHSYVDLSGKRIGQHVKGLVNAVLRKIADLDPTAEPDKIYDPSNQAAWNSCPAWLWERWVNHFGLNGATELCQYQTRVPGLTIRRNINKVSAKELILALDTVGVELESYSDSDIFFLANSRGSLLRDHDLFKNGSYSFQDRAAGAVIEILQPQPGEIILDVCAAPGSKVLYAAELLGTDATYKILAFDSDPNRVEIAQSDQTRHGCDNIVWEVADAAKAEYPVADAILVDVPCSGTGVIGRRPDIRWRRQPQDIEEMSQLALGILKNVSRAVKTGGRLVYATCSLEPEENWNVIEAFLKFNPRFSIEKIDQLIPAKWINSNQCMETFPPRDRVDGIFAARLKLT